jgi:hypothetical protein
MEDIVAVFCPSKTRLPPTDLRALGRLTEVMPAPGVIITSPSRAVHSLMEAKSPGFEMEI